MATALLLLAFAFGEPRGVLAVLALGLVFAAAGRVLAAVAQPALILALPVLVLLLVLHGLMGPEPRAALLGVPLSEPGLTRALVYGGRIAAIVVVSLTTLATVSPARLVEAMAERRVAFGWTYLLASTLTVVPRLRARAAAILDAQRCRGLAIRGSPPARLRALAPLVLPLVLGALAEVDEQVLALHARGASPGAIRTALDPPPDSAAQRLLRATLALIALAAYTWKFWSMRA